MVQFDGNALVYRAFHALPPLTRFINEFIVLSAAYQRLSVQAVKGAALECSLRCVQMSYMTPPMAPAIFYLRGAPEEVRTVDMYRGIVPFVAMQIIGLALIVRFPELALWLPAKVYGS